MADDIKCPVCGKVGIPDFHSADVNCPCCGSDLSIYRAIDQIPEEGHKRNIWKPISAAALVAAAGLGTALFLQKPVATLTSGTTELNQLRDSITLLTNQLAEIKEANESNQVAYKYVVKKGDSYWSISKKFYGKGTRYVELLQDNNRTEDSSLEVGDTLLIKQ